MGLGCSPSIEAPTSSTLAREAALRSEPGLVPAEWTVTASPASCRARAAAIWDLPPFLTQTNRTEGVLMAAPVGG